MQKAFILLLILFLTNMPSLYYGLYMHYSWVNTVQHFLGGFLMAMFMTAYLKNNLQEKAFIRNMLIVAGATTFIGVVWEFSEYLANQTLIEPFYRWFKIRAYFMGDLNDTISDLLLDILGAISFWISYHFWNKKSRSSERLLP